MDNDHGMGWDGMGWEAWDGMGWEAWDGKHGMGSMGWDGAYCPISTLNTLWSQTIVAPFGNVHSPSFNLGPLYWPINRESFKGSIVIDSLFAGIGFPNNLSYNAAVSAWPTMDLYSFFVVINNQDTSQSKSITFVLVST